MFINFQESFMSFRFLAASSAALILALTPLAQAQTAAPAPAAAPAAAAAPAPAPAAAPAPAKATSGDVSEGKVAHYGRKFNGRKTASGERFNAGAMTMAHKTLPFGTLVKVTNLANKRSVVVRVNDRGPSTPDRVGDLTTAAGKKIRMMRSGVVDAKLEVVGMSKKRMGMAGKGKKTMKAKAAK
jgi:rare lipoprotein A